MPHRTMRMPALVMGAALSLWACTSERCGAVRAALVTPEEVAQAATLAALSRDGGTLDVRDPIAPGNWRVDVRPGAWIEVIPGADGGIAEGCLPTSGLFLPDRGEPDADEDFAHVAVRVKLKALPDGGFEAGRIWMDGRPKCRSCPEHPYVEKDRDGRCPIHP